MTPAPPPINRPATVPGFFAALAGRLRNVIAGPLIIGTDSL
jgi:hypothetical protein